LILHTLTESVLSIQNTIQSGRFTCGTANRSLFSNGKDNNAQGKLISSHTLRNAVAKKPVMREYGEKV